jgi:hypothetical protein
MAEVLIGHIKNVLDSSVRECHDSQLLDRDIHRSLNYRKLQENHERKCLAIKSKDCETLVIGNLRFGHVRRVGREHRSGVCYVT